MQKLSPLILTLFITTVLCSKDVTNNNNNDKLLSVVAVYRHGDRSPYTTYATDPYRNESYWPDGFGQLTNKGKLRQYNLGKWFRQRYKQLLSATYSPKQIYIQSIDADNTLMSAYATLAGLYPPKTRQIWNPTVGLLWQPIPVHTIPQLDDALLAMTKICPRYIKQLHTLHGSIDVIEIDRKNRPLYDMLSNMTGDSMASVQDLARLYETLSVEDAMNLTLPEWTKQVYPEPLKRWALYAFTIPCYTRELARLKTGPFFNQLLEFFIAKTSVNHSAEYLHRFRMYSARDDTLADLLTSMLVHQTELPGYADTLIFELFSSTNSDNSTNTTNSTNNNNTTFYVNLLYKNQTEDDVRTIKLNNCDVNCELSDFITLLEPIAVNLHDWEKECYNF